MKKYLLLLAILICSVSYGQGCVSGNCFNGEGTYIWPNGDKYYGSWLNGKFDGKGDFLWFDGRSYSGDWQNNKKHGEGVFKWGNGAIYSGYWHNDMKNGLGYYLYPTGERYAGEWKFGKQHGFGVIFSRDDEIIQEGVYVNDKFKYSQKFLPEDQGPDRKNSQSHQPDILVSSGTGFAVSYSGYILTNNHVVNGCERVNIQFNEESELVAKIIAIDDTHDLALLKINRSPLAVLSMDNDGPQLLNEIFVAGYPFGNSISSSIKITKGIVSSMKGYGDNDSNIQIDAAIQPGNSGGPILNEKANVIGVAVSKLDAVKVLENLGVIPENINFGIKSNIVKDFLNKNSISGLPGPNNYSVSTKEFSDMVSKATFFVSCIMSVS